STLHITLRSIIFPYTTLFRSITGVTPIFEKLDLKEKSSVEQFFNKHSDIKGVIHFAASKAVGESVEKPLLYYENNLNTLIYMLRSEEHTSELQSRENLVCRLL